jgi:hypothetical protein
MRSIFYLSFLLLLISCGPSLCDCVWDQTDNKNDCKSIYKNRLGTEYPSFVRLESVRKGSCEEYGKDVTKRLKDAGY